MKEQAAVPNPNYREERVPADTQEEARVTANLLAQGWTLEGRNVERADDALGHVRLTFGRIDQP
jgi:hypothetical protein